MSYTDQKLLGDMSLGDVMNYLENKIDEATNDVYPEFPDEDGDYMLMLTMSDGTATLSWETISAS